MKLVMDMALGAFSLTCLVMAVVNRNNVSGVVWALLWIAEQIHMEDV